MSRLINLGLCLLLAYVTFGQKCDQAIDEFHECMKNKMSPKDQNQARDGMKAKFDKCFTDNACQLPQSPSGGQGGPGGRAGPRPAGQGGQQGGQQGDQCHQNVQQKTKDYLLQCVRKSDPTFNFPQDGHGGPGPFGPGPHGGPGGPPGGPEREGGKNAGQQLILQACNNNQGKADRVEQCVKEIFTEMSKQPHLDIEQTKQAHCQAEIDCKANVPSNCAILMETRRKAVCQCGQEAQKKSQDFMKTEPTCTNVQQAHGMGNPGPGALVPAHDCNQDPCAHGNRG